MKKWAAFERNELIPPCPKDCKDRGAGCAASCEAWQAYLVKRDVLYAERLKKSGTKGVTQARRRR